MSGMKHLIGFLFCLLLGGITSSHEPAPLCSSYDDSSSSTTNTNANIVTITTTTSDKYNFGSSSSEIHSYDVNGVNCTDLDDVNFPFSCIQYLSADGSAFEVRNGTYLTSSASSNKAANSHNCIDTMQASLESTAEDWEYSDDTDTDTDTAGTDAAEVFLSEYPIRNKEELKQKAHGQYPCNIPKIDLRVTEGELRSERSISDLPDIPTIYIGWADRNAPLSSSTSKENMTSLPNGKAHNIMQWRTHPTDG